MSKPMIEKLFLAERISPIVRQFEFKQVEKAFNVGEMSFKSELEDGSYVCMDDLSDIKWENLSISFCDFQSAIAFMFDNFTPSEVRTIDSTIQFYLTLFPYDKLITANQESKTIVTLYKHSSYFSMDFKLFTVLFDDDISKWRFFINDKWMQRSSMGGLTFDNLYSTIIGCFKFMIHEIFVKPPETINYQIFKDVYDNRKNFDFLTMRYRNVFIHEKDVDFARHLQDIKAVKVIEELTGSSHKTPPNVIYLEGGFLVERNMLNVAKLRHTHFSLCHESLYLFDSIFNGSFTLEQIDYLKKILILLKTVDDCFEQRKNNMIHVTRKNNGKKSVFNLLFEKAPFSFKLGRHTIDVDVFISVSLLMNSKYVSIKAHSIKEAYEYMYTAFIQNVSDSFKIPVEDVTDEHIILLAMDNY